jgi:hypothetical protein
MDIEAMESCKSGVEKMGWVPAAVEGSELTGLKSSSFLTSRINQSSNCGSFVKAGIRTFYRQARRVGIGLPWRWFRSRLLEVSDIEMKAAK